MKLLLLISSTATAQVSGFVSNRNTLNSASSNIDKKGCNCGADRDENAMDRQPGRAQLWLPNHSRSAWSGLCGNIIILILVM